MANSICTIDGCERKHNARGWCLAHYKKWQKYGDPLGLHVVIKKYCSVDSCDDVFYAREMCKTHYRRMMKSGDINRGRERRVCEVEGCAEFRFSNGFCIKHFTRWKRHGSPVARLAGEVVAGKRICPGCGIDTDLDCYTPGSTGRCKPCVAKAKRDKYVPLPPPDLSPIRCAHCGEWFKPRSVRVLLCSNECVKQRARENDLDHSHRYRARKRKATVEAVRRAEVFERDGWVCGICSLPIPKDARHPSPFSASLDHIIPISRGGHHSMSNTQASHLRCNVSKGARLIT